jgi:hypothetical protein
MIQWATASSSQTVLDGKALEKDGFRDTLRADTHSEFAPFVKDTVIFAWNRSQASHINITGDINGIYHQ